MAVSATVEPFFLRAVDRSLFCVCYRPPADTLQRHPVLHVPALCEEMNKARRMVSLTARRLAEHGHPVLVLDLTGTGDSSHDFGDATWDLWRDDVLRGAAWLKERTGQTPILWGLRAGCLLIDSTLAAAGPAAAGLVFWQPVLSGESALTQLLRLRSFGDFASGGQRRESVKELVALLQGGQQIEVAGYALAPALALPLRSVRLGGPHFRDIDVTWVEVAPETPAAIAPPSESCIASLQALGVRVSAIAVSGQAFWMTQEIAECQALIDATVAKLQQS